jgi:hypothetical protein
MSFVLIVDELDESKRYFGPFLSVTVLLSIATALVERAEIADFGIGRLEPVSHVHQRPA